MYWNEAGLNRKYVKSNSLSVTVLLVVDCDDALHKWNNNHSFFLDFESTVLDVSYFSMIRFFKNPHTTHGPAYPPHIIPTPPSLNLIWRKVVESLSEKSLRVRS